MRWIAKAALQKALSALPNNQAVNYWFQRHVTRTLPRSGINLHLHIELASRHLRMFARHGACPIGKARLFEFGAGWDLIGPLTYYALGVDSQVLVDIRPNLRLELVQRAWADLNRLRMVIERVSGMPARDLGSAPPDGPKALEQRFGISYMAPHDARDTGLPAGSFDFVSSTDTVEHIPGPDLRRILAEIGRLLAPGGVLSCTIDLQDIYSYFDSSISRYNYLRFSETVWSLANSDLHYQSRLRISDYLDMIDAAGLSIVDQVIEEPTPEDLAELSGLPPAPRFLREYPLATLGVKSAHLVARRP
jgi:SAM-dependent methyltransferase